MKNVLVVSAHPDDEILGVGGALIRHRDQGDNIAWLIITELNDEVGFSSDRVIAREKEIELIANKLKMQVFKLGYPTMTLTQRELIEMVPKISEVFNSFEPEVVYTLNRSDAHSDHRITFDAVAACTKSFRYPFIREVLMYECISETEFAPTLHEKVFLPNCYVDISEQLKEKISLMEIYESELGDHPFPRSLENIKALATYRGASCSVKYAEAFQILKSYRFERL